MNSLIRANESASFTITLKEKDSISVCWFCFFFNFLWNHFGFGIENALSYSLSLQSLHLLPLSGSYRITLNNLFPKSLSKLVLWELKWCDWYLSFGSQLPSPVARLVSRDCLTLCLHFLFHNTILLFLVNTLCNIQSNSPLSLMFAPFRY